ncbi:MAG: NAD(P)/FAD-dependent oxidoreductase [Chloroflexota bacterium]|nr:MAG: NAD(P)/FAD-dependent oxidoreductase [Chloroflexota bacterium]
MTRAYDVIIIGAGPNGLSAGAYLAKAGMKVLLLDKRYELGGGLATEEVTLPQYLHNTHAIYHMMVDYAPPFQDFQLQETYKLRYVHPDVQFAMPLGDGRSLCIYRDVDKTCDSIARFSARDAESYRQVHRRFGEMVDSFLAPATYAPPEPAPLQAAKLELTDIGRDITSISMRTPEEIVNDLFENDHVRTLMLYVACHWGLEYDSPGVSYLVPLFINRATNYRLLVGGSHRLSNALLKVVLENQGVTLTSARVKRIIVEGEEAKGVELEDGTEIRANKAVVSTVDLHQTFFSLVGEKNLDNDFVEKIKLWQWEKWSLFGVHMALEEAPRFSAAASNSEVDAACVYVLGYESSADLKRHWDAIRQGEQLKNAGFTCCFPSIHDASQAPPGRATGVISQMAPYNLKEGAQRWLNFKYKEELAENCVATLGRYAPNMTADNVLWKYISSPADIENKFPNMVQGSLKQGLYHPLQMGFLRPNEDCSDHRTPIRNLYLGGACSFPGGLVTFGPGYLTANVVAEDMGIDKWWAEPESITKAREKGLM